jgi:Trypsin-like peptidase domain
VNPLAATGIVVISNAGLPQVIDGILGTCFAFREPHCWLTAAHVVPDPAPETLAVVTPHAPRDIPLRVVEAVRHPAADVCALRTSDGAEVEPFWNPVDNLGLGEEFMVYGYPEDILGPDARLPTPRLLTGHMQRFYLHRSHAGYEYSAIEMSTAVPAGLSGGPLFRPGAPQMVTGLAADDLQSTTVFESDEEIEIDGERRRTVYRKVISYGVAVRLGPLAEWLDSVVPSAR